MSLTIILSGPKSSMPQARTALSGVGAVQPGEHDHGLSPLASGEDTREPQGFITLLGGDVDRALAVAQTLGWSLRMHHETPEIPAPNSLDVKLARMQAQIDELKGRP